MSKYNILQLSSSSDIGGTETMILHLISQANRDLFDYTVFSLVGGGELTKRAQNLGYNAQNLHLHHPFQLGKVFKLYRLMKSGRFDLVQTYGLRADSVGRVIARLAKIPVVVSGIRSPDPWRKWYHTLIDRATLRFADFFISNSQAGKKSRIQREKYPENLIRVIYNGILLPPSFSCEEKTSFREKYGVTDETEPVVALVANLRVMKGHRDVIQAIPALKKTFPRILFLFAGRDDSAGEMKRLAREKQVSENIRFLGYCACPAEILAISDVFLLPSHWEGCPAALLEAMSMKLPCVATRVGGIPEIIKQGENGRLITANDPGSIVAALKELIENPGKAEKLARAAEQTIAARFHIHRMIREYENLYTKLIEEKRPL